MCTVMFAVISTDIIDITTVACFHLLLLAVVTVILVFSFAVVTIVTIL